VVVVVVVVYRIDIPIISTSRACEKKVMFHLNVDIGNQLIVLILPQRGELANKKVIFIINCEMRHQ